MFAETGPPGIRVYDGYSENNRMLSGVMEYETGRVPEAYPVDPLTVIFTFPETRGIPEIRPVDEIESPLGKFKPLYETTDRPLREDAVTWNDGIAMF